MNEIQPQEKELLPVQTRVLVCVYCKVKFTLQFITRTPKYCPCCGRLAQVEEPEITSNST